MELTLELPDVKPFSEVNGQYLKEMFIAIIPELWQRFPDLKILLKKSAELPFKAEPEIIETTENEEAAYEFLCKILDKLNTDIEELTSRLKTSLDHLDKLDYERRKNEQNC